MTRSHRQYTRRVRYPPETADWQPALPRRSEPKTPGKQRSGVGPDPGFGVAQDNNDDVAPRSRTARNETVTSRFGVAGFHAVAKGKPFQNLVRVFQFAGPTVGVAKN